MKKVIILAILLLGNPLTTGRFSTPTGEILFWKWFDDELGVIDSNQKCIWNEGIPRDCNIQELSIMLYSMSGQ